MDESDKQPTKRKRYGNMAQSRNKLKSFVSKDLQELSTLFNSFGVGVISLSIDKAASHYVHLRLDLQEFLKAFKNIHQAYYVYGARKIKGDREYCMVYFYEGRVLVECIAKKADVLKAFKDNMEEGDFMI